MSLIDKIRAEHLNARKKRLAIDASILTVLRGEAEKVGKDKGNRDPSDDEVIQVIRKLVKSGNEMKDLIQEKILKMGVPQTSDTAQLANTILELDILQGLLPLQMGESEIVQAVKETVDELGATTVKQMGQVMGELRKRFGNNLNMATASKAVKELLS